MNWDKVKIGDWYKHLATGWVGQVHSWTGPKSATVLFPESKYVITYDLGGVRVKALEMTQLCLDYTDWVKVDEPAEVTERNRKYNEDRAKEQS